MGKKRYWMSEELAKAIQDVIGREALRADSLTDAGPRHSPARAIITCVLHEDIDSTVEMVPCTQLMIIQDRGDKRAWQVVIDPASTTAFSLTVNGTTIGPFTASTTTTAFQTALNTITSPSTPQGWSVHGNFFVFPAPELIVATGGTAAEAYEVPWIPLVGDGYSTTVGSRRLAQAGEFKRGSTQSAEFVHGYGFAIASAPASAVDSSAVSSGCPCTCIENGDIIVNGIETTSQWVLTMGEESFRQANGKILFSAGGYAVVWNSDRRLWVNDIGDVLTAVWTDGSDATEATTMDGELTMEYPASGQPTVKLCVTGTVPTQPGAAGYAAGYPAGFSSGYSDGFAGNPEEASGDSGEFGSFSGDAGSEGSAMSEWEIAYRAGFDEGYAAGYEQGAIDAASGSGSGS